MGQHIKFGKVKISGEGQIRKPSPMGLFVQEVLNRLIRPEVFAKYDGDQRLVKQEVYRRKKKAWLANEFMFLLTRTSFDLGIRHEFAHRILEEFQWCGSSEWRLHKNWLIAKFNDLIQQYDPPPSSPE